MFGIPIINVIVRLELNIKQPVCFLKNAAGSDQIENSCNIFSSVSKEANPCKKEQPPTLQDVEGHRVSSSHGLL